MLSSNYRLGEFQAALLLSQLEKIDEYWERRHTLYHEYIQRLGISGVDWPQPVPDAKSAYHLFTIWVEPDRRDEILAKLGQAGIGSAVNYRAIHLLSYFRKRFGFKEGDFPIAERIGDSTITLPFYVKLQLDDIQTVDRTLRDVVLNGNYGEK